jgi:4-amino-4-deoxy-L-arabinose transferase-like glycosyltransferase
MKNRSSLDFFIIAGLFLLFLTITLPGIRWGAPAVWHPDELVTWVDRALEGRYTFDEYNFDYPSLPKYSQFFLGKILYRLGADRAGFILAARSLSVLLGAGTVVLVYLMTRLVGGPLGISLLAAGLVLSSSEYAVNSRFAHNDLYLAFFSTLTVFFALHYMLHGNKLWLYASFLGVGLAASSKYNGAALLILPIACYLARNWGSTRSNLMNKLETLFIGVILAYLGFGVGTPRALTYPAFYFKRMLPALLRHGTYERTPGDVIGLVGQWQVLIKTLGGGVALLCLAGLIFYVIVIILRWRGRPAPSLVENKPLGVLLLSVLCLDLPIMLSYNYQPRFFVSLIPLLAILGSLLVGDVARILGQRELRLARTGLIALVVILLGYSFLRVTSVTLLFLNDARIPASDFIVSLPQKTSLEFTLYPPRFPPRHFKRLHSYPIFFPKFPGQQPPEDKNHVFNIGEIGLDERSTDYLVVDDFTYTRFINPATCQALPAECDFFTRLLADQTDYQLIQRFKYALPGFLPQLRLAFVNPEILIYERQP